MPGQPREGQERFSQREGAMTGCLEEKLSSARAYVIFVPAGTSTFRARLNTLRPYAFSFLLLYLLSCTRHESESAHTPCLSGVDF